MIIKPFEPSAFNIGLRALLTRLHPSHPKYEKLHQELQTQIAGDNGEQYVMKELQNINFHREFHILHNVILPSRLPLQIDILIITSKEIIILEIKNIKGNVHFKSNPRQLIRTTESNEVNIFTHPEIQIEQYIKGMKDFIVQHDFDIPIYGVVVFPFNNVNITHEQVTTPIILAKELPLFLSTLPPQKKSHNINQLTNKIMQYNKIKTPYPLCTYYNIEHSAILRGIICPTCNSRNIQKTKRNWHCRNCLNTSSDAHIHALNDYYMLFGNKITNQQLRYFLNINNPDIAKRLLKKASINKIGMRRHTVYELKFPQ